MTTFQRERAHDVYCEMEPLLRKHWEEIAHYADIKLNPDTAFYTAMEDAGALRVFTARDDFRKLVGYAVYFVKRNPHYRDSLQAVQDILFLEPANRGTTVGYRLIKFADDGLRDEGVQVVYQHVKAKPELDFGPLLEKQGYVMVDKIFAKRLDKETA